MSNRSTITRVDAPIRREIRVDALNGFGLFGPSDQDMGISSGSKQTITGVNLFAEYLYLPAADAVLAMIMVTVSAPSMDTSPSLWSSRDSSIAAARPPRVDTRRTLKGMMPSPSKCNATSSPVVNST